MNLSTVYESSPDALEGQVTAQLAASFHRWLGEYSESLDTEGLDLPEFMVGLKAYILDVLGDDPRIAVTYTAPVNNEVELTIKLGETQAVVIVTMEPSND